MIVKVSNRYFNANAVTVIQKYRNRNVPDWEVGSKITEQGTRICFGPVQYIEIKDITPQKVMKIINKALSSETEGRG